MNPEGAAFDKLVAGVENNNDLMSTAPTIGYTFRDITTGEKDPEVWGNHPVRDGSRRHGDTNAVHQGVPPGE